MAEITAALVKELREKTDAPMMECKKALTEAEGDLARAEEILRVKLGNKASKAAARVTAEGLIGLFISADAKKGAVIEVNCETDFVAKNDDFVAFVNKLAELVATQNPADVAALSALPYGDGTVETTRTALIGKIGENMAIRRFERIETPNALANARRPHRRAGRVQRLGRSRRIWPCTSRPPSPGSERRWRERRRHRRRALGRRAEGRRIGQAG